MLMSDPSTIVFGEKILIFLVGIVVFLVGMRITVRASNELSPQQLKEDWLMEYAVSGVDEDETSPLAVVLLGTVLMTLGTWHLAVVLMDWPIPAFYKQLGHLFGI